MFVLTEYLTTQSNQTQMEDGNPVNPIDCYSGIDENAVNGTMERRKNLDGVAAITLGQACPIVSLESKN
eukprot:gene21386-biopygen7330